jgi:3-oxoacyl-[acyl-carrier protein] reductase
MNPYPVAIVTGASKGIGKSCAVGLSRKGYQIVLIARTESKLQEVACEIEEKYTKDKALSPIVYPFDITDENKINAAIQDIKKRLGRIDVLLNNAGVSIKGSVDMSAAKFDQLFKANLRAPFLFLKGVVPIMKEQGNGHIFNIASRSGKHGFKNKGGYAATKFGMVGLAESLYRELAPEGVSVTTICPAWVNTQMARKATAPLLPDEMIQPEDIMRTIEWVLDLSPGACVKEIVLECPKSII